MDEYQNSKIEIAKALKSIRAISSELEFEEIKGILLENKDQSAITDAIKGMEVEDEFAIITKLLDTTSNLFCFEQRPIIEGNYKVVDFFATIKPSCFAWRESNKKFNEYNCLIEVKSTRKEVFKLRRSDLTKYRNFAKIMKLPLFFAIRFNPEKNFDPWVIVKDNIENSSLNIRIEDSKDNYRSVFWDDFIIEFNDKIILEYSFSKESLEGVYMRNSYGTLVEMNFKINNETIYSIKDSNCYIISALFNTIGISLIQMNKDNSILQFKPNPQPFSISNIIYRLHNVPVTDNGNRWFDASKILTRTEGSMHNSLLDRNFFLNLIFPMIKKGIVKFHSTLDQHIKWKELGGIH